MGKHKGTTYFFLSEGGFLRGIKYEEAIPFSSVLNTINRMSRSHTIKIVFQNKIYSLYQRSSNTREYILAISGDYR